MKQIILTQNQIAIIDDEDFDKVVKYKWYAAYDPHTKSFYVVSYRDNNPIKLHRFIMNLEKGDKRQVDHINRNTLDNRKGNLRIVNDRINAYNRKNNSKYGANIRREGAFNKYRCQLYYKKQRIHLGMFDTLEEAQQARHKFLTEHNIKE